MFYRVLSVYIIFLLLIRCVGGELRARLVGGTEWSGRLEVSINDTWGTVCGNGFGSNEAQVVCRMLGFHNPRAVSVGSDMFGEGSGAIFSAICTGTEKNIEECAHGRITDCNHQYDVGVICNIPGEITVRLLNGSIPGEITVRLLNGSRWFGLLEVLYDGVWSTVCSRGFGHKEVQVVCNILKQPSSDAVAMSFPNYFRGRDEASILFSDLDCDGTETSLAQCKHSGFYNHTCTHDEDITVTCALNAAYRLAGTRSTRIDMGRLEIIVGPLEIQGGQGKETIVPRVWSGVCGNTYSPISTARVICKQLGHSYSGAMLVSGSSFGPSAGFWRTEVSCMGNETNMMICVQLVSGYSLSCPTHEMGVVCSNTNPGLYILLETTEKDAVYPPIEGSNVSLKCEGTKAIHSAAIYMWTETAGGRPSGAHLIFETLTRTHNGRRVKCEVHVNSNGSNEMVSSEAIKLQVYYKPLITITSDANTCQLHTSSNTCYVTLGQDVTFNCSAESNPLPESFEWSKKDMATNEKLYITSANASRHEGLYNCTVKTKSYDHDSRLPLSASYIFTVIVQEPPAVVGFTANGEDNTTIILDENSNVSLACEATGRPTPNMVLIKGANSRELSRRSQSDSNSTKKYANIFFFLQGITCQDSGGYRCEAHNSVGHGSRTLIILVPCAPTVKGLKGSLPPVTSINFQESFTLELIAYPPPEIKQLSYYGPGNDTLGGQLEDRLHVTCGTNTFAPALVTCKIIVINNSDDGVYRIVFYNDFGHLSFNFTRGNLKLMSIHIWASLLAATIS